MGVLVFSNQKGGVGKSTLSVLFAHWLADKQRARVCVIDLDTQCNSSKSLVSFSGGMQACSLFAGEGLRLPKTAEARITLFGGSKQLADLELARPDLVIPQFRRHVAALDETFDWVVIDTPPALGLRMSAALIAADSVLCPIELEEYSIDGVTDMLKTVFGIRRRYNPRLRLTGILANRFNPHSVRQKAALQDLVLNFSEFVLPAKISTRSAIPEGLAAGLPVWKLTKSSARESSVELLTAFELIRQRIEAPDATTPDVAPGGHTAGEGAQ